MTNRVPPQSLDIEKSVLGAAMTDAMCAAMLVDVCTEDDFYGQNNKTIFRKIISLYRDNENIDIITVSQGIPDALSVLAAECCENPSWGSRLKSHIKILRQKSVLRRAIIFANNLLAGAYDPECIPTEVIGVAQRDILRLDVDLGRKRLKHIRDVMPGMIETIEKIYQNGGTIGIPTGLCDLDRKFSGFCPGDMTVIAGRPSMGKTAFALHCAIHAAKNKRGPIVIYSLEMPENQLAMRMVCAEAGLNMQKLRDGTLPKRDFPKFSIACGPVASMDIYIDDTPGLTPTSLNARSRRLKAEYGLGVVMVDYLQLMAVSGKYESRRAEIEYISRSLKGTAKELDVAMVPLSQLSRRCEERPDKRPLLSDLRASGQIEQDADSVLFLYRDDIYNRNSTDNSGICEIIIGKQRNGAAGVSIKTVFEEKTMKFHNLAETENEIVDVRTPYKEN